MILLMIGPSTWPLMPKWHFWPCLVIDIVMAPLIVYAILLTVGDIAMVMRSLL